MNSQRALILIATIVVAASLQQARTNAQERNAATKLHGVHPVQIANDEHQVPQEAVSTPVMSKLLPDFPGKEVVMLTVTYPPGHSGPVHRHNADGFIYVLEGSVEMAVNRGEPVTLGPGQTFYEGPNDVHTVGRNSSKSRQAKFLVFLIKDKDAPISVPVK